MKKTYFILLGVFSLMLALLLVAIFVLVPIKNNEVIKIEEYSGIIIEKRIEQMHHGHIYLILDLGDYKKTINPSSYPNLLQKSVVGDSIFKIKGEMRIVVKNENKNLNFYYNKKSINSTLIFLAFTFSSGFIALFFVINSIEEK